jgi:hypothetical protein
VREAGEGVVCSINCESWLNRKLPNRRTTPVLINSPAWGFFADTHALFDGRAPCHQAHTNFRLNQFATVLTRRLPK